MLCDPLSIIATAMEWLYSGKSWCSDGAVEKGQDLLSDFLWWLFNNENSAL